MDFFIFIAMPLLFVAVMIGVICLSFGLELVAELFEKDRAEKPKMHKLTSKAKVAFILGSIAVFFIVMMPPYKQMSGERFQLALFHGGNVLAIVMMLVAIWLIGMIIHQIVKKNEDIEPIIPYFLGFYILGHATAIFGWGSLMEYFQMIWKMVMVVL